jgi:uncharacterized membrane protein
MHELLQHCFGWVCGQSPEHTWSPGGVLLPCCQRCTGLYIGAFVAAMFHFVLRPAPTNRWLWLNGGFLMFMIPFGFHWVPQGPLLRMITGVVFGFGLVAFLWLPLGRAGSRESAQSAPAQSGERPPASLLLPLALTLALAPWLALHGNSLAAHALVLLATGGLLTLAGLLAVNIVHALLGLARWACRARPLNPAHGTDP